MESSLESSVRAISASYARLDSISSNIANQSTQGYKRRISIAQSPQDFTQALQAQQTNPAAATSVDMRPGTIKLTGRPLDIALAQDHYISVRSATGNYYLRGGSLQLNSAGQLTSSAGHPVQAAQGDVYLTTTEVRIDSQGRIYERDREVAQLQIVRLSAGHLSPSADGSGFVMREGAVESSTAVANAVSQGQIEMSNVNVTQEMVQMIETVRHAEALHKAAQGYEQMMQTAVRTLGGL